jgi:hypothetical protein
MVSVGDHFFFFLTLMNYDLNMYSQIPYELLQDCGYRQNVFFCKIALLW